MKNDIYINAINEARKLMYEQTLKNKAPSWLITMLAQKVGKELANAYNVIVKAYVGAIQSLSECISAIIAIFRYKKIK